MADPDWAWDFSMDPGHALCDVGAQVTDSVTKCPAIQGTFTGQLHQLLVEEGSTQASASGNPQETRMLKASETFTKVSPSSPSSPVRSEVCFGAEFRVL